MASSTSSSKAIYMPWKKYPRPYLPDKLVIPLPIPHPAHIACTIYNRDSDDPIPLESEICQSILKGIEESYGTLKGDGKHSSVTLKPPQFSGSIYKRRTSFQELDGTEEAGKPSKRPVRARTRASPPSWNRKQVTTTFRPPKAFITGRSTTGDNEKETIQVA